MKSIKVFNFDVPVLYVEMSDEFDGEFKDRKIKIRRNSEDQDQTLIHEIIHAVFYYGNFSQAVQDGVEEIIAENVAQTICDNFDVRLKKID